MTTQKIAVIGAKGLPAKQGGIERYCQEMYPRMVEQGYLIDLYARGSYTNSTKFLTNYCHGVRVISIPSITIPGFDALTNCSLAMIIAIFAQYDVIHIHALGPALWCWIGKFFTKSKIIVTCHGLDWQRSKWGKLSSQLIRLGEWMAVKWADEIIVVSQYLKTYFQQTYGKKTSYIPTAPGNYLPCDPGFTYLKSLALEPKKYILFLGRLVPEKRPDLLINAFEKLQPNDWKLVLAGGHSDTQDYYIKLKQNAAKNPNICFTGEVKGALLSEIVRGAGLFVLPSDIEGLPLVMLEAMREGIPVVASNIAPHQQLMGDNRGLLFEAGNLESCINCLHQALASPCELETMSKKSQDYIKNYHNWEKIVAKHLSLYGSIQGKSQKAILRPFDKLRTKQAQ